MTENPEYLIKSQPPEPRPGPPKGESSEPPSDGETPPQQTAPQVPTIIRKSLDPASEGEPLAGSDSADSTG